MRARRERRFEDACAPCINTDCGPHRRAIFDSGDHPADFLILKRRRSAGASAFAANVDDRCACLQHRGGAGAAGLRIIMRSAIGETVGRDVEDAHHLRLVEPHHARTAFERGMYQRKVAPLRPRILGHTGGQAIEHFRHGCGIGEPPTYRRAAAALDDRKFAGIDHAPGNAHRIAFDRLRAGRKGNRAEIDLVIHCSANPPRN